MEINIIELEYLPVFVAKNSRALKRRRYMGFCVFLLYEMLIVVLRYGGNKAKKG